MINKLDAAVCKILVDEGFVSRANLETVIEKSPAAGGEAWIRQLITNGLLDEAKTLALLGARLKLEFRTIKNIAIAKDIIDRVPVKITSHYKFLPLTLERNILTIGVYYPMELKTLDEIRFQVGVDVNQVLCLRDDMLELLRKYYGFGAETIERMFLKGDAKKLSKTILDKDALDDIEKLDEDATVANLVNQIIFDAYKKRATDIHIEPYRGQVRFRYRIDGVLYDANVSPSVKHFISSILSRIKIMSNLDIVERRLPQDGQAVVMSKDERVDLRVSFIPTPYGESVVIRILPTFVLHDLNKLGLSPKDAVQLKDLLKRPNGIIFVTGPTGSGKTTTLYASLNTLNSNERKIITIEDPIEYEIPGITQIQVTPQVGLTFAAGLKSILRHDPDIIMVGEVRDLETAEIAVRVALTGHLVFSTLHTNNAASSVHRLMDIGIEPYLIQSSTIAFIAQRLVRVLCPKCKKISGKPGIELVNLLKNRLHIDDMSSIQLFKNEGCDHCNNTGYYGRTAIYEMLVLSDDIKDLIQAKASARDIERAAVASGLETLLDSGLRKIVAGETTVEEIMNTLFVGGEMASYSLLDIKDKESLLNSAPPRPGYYPDNKRVYSRVSVKLPIAFSIHKGMTLEMKEKMKMAGISESDYYKQHSSYTDNISAGGLVFRYDLPLIPGTILDMKISIPQAPGGAYKVIDCLARVIRIEELSGADQFGVAECFLDMSGADRLALKSFVEKETKGF